MSDKNSELPGQFNRAAAESAAAAAGAHTGGSVETTGKMFKRSLNMWLVPFVRLHRIPVVRRIWVYIFCMGIYTTAIHFLVQGRIPKDALKDLGSAAYTGVILGLLLVFRTNSAYERWWEGRKLWGQLMNDSRNLCIKAKSFAKVSNAEKVRLGELVVSFAFALKHHLRDSRPVKLIPGTDDATNINLPVSIAGKIYDIIAEWHESNSIDGFTRLQLDAHARGFMDIQGACERIRSTPLAISYRAFLRQGIALSLLALPWYIPESTSLVLSLPVVLMGAYFLVGLELIAEDIEDPFGDDGDDLPLDQICHGIQTTVTEILQIPKQQFTVAMKLPRVDPLKESLD